MEKVATGTVLDLIQANAGQAVLHFRGQAIPGDLLLRKADRLAAALARAGVEPTSRVAVLLERSPDALAALLALWRLGAVHVPLDPLLPPARLVLLAEEARPGFLLCRPELEHKCGVLACARIVLPPIAWNEAGLSGKVDQTGGMAWPASDASAYLLHTSGSSGRPKAVEISHGSLRALFDGVLPLLELDASRVFLGLAAFTFDIAFFEVLAPLMLGAALVLLDEEERGDPRAVASAIRRHACNVVQATPSLWRLLLETGWPGASVTAISTGEPLPLPLAASLLERCPRLWNLYGPTEATLWASAARLSAGSLERSEGPYASIGHALPGVDLFLRGRSRKAFGRARDTAGELCIAGTGLARGYFGRPALSRRKFLTAGGRRAYRSGDRCRLRPDGEFDYLGRLDAQLKINGQRIEPQEIELALERHPGVRQALVAPWRDAAGNAVSLLAWVVHEKGEPNRTAEKLNGFLRATLPAWMLPGRYLFVESLPLNAAGKKDRKALPPHPDSPSPPAEEFSNPLEREVAGLFREILELPTLGRFDSFFDRGGNSMLAATLLLALNQRWDAQLSLKELLLSPPTVDRVCRLLRRDARQGRDRRLGREISQQGEPVAGHAPD